MDYKIDISYTPLCKDKEFLIPRHGLGQGVKDVQQIMDLQWLYSFHSVGEQMRVCFISGVLGVMVAEIRSGPLVLNS
jgi:hypothetical protein